MVSEDQGVVGFLGLDEVSLELAASLLKSGYDVQVFETSSPLVDEFSKLGGRRCRNAMEMGKGLAALVILISHDDQMNDIIREHEGILKGLEKDATIIFHAAGPLVDLHQSEKILEASYHTHPIVDIYVSRAASDNLNGKLLIISSGKSGDAHRAKPILSAMCEKLYLFEGELGAGSKAKLVIELLEGIHFIASVEAISLGTQAGIHPWILYDIISNAAGNSWVFKNYLPQLLRGNQTKHHFLNAMIENMGTVLAKAKSLVFPVPLLTVAYQQLIAGFSHGTKDDDDDDTTLLKVCEEVFGVSIGDSANAKSYNPEEIAHQISAKSVTVKRVGFVGLGAMGFGMATHLLKSNFSVTGFDVYKPTLSRFADAGGLIGSSPAEVSQDADVLVVMVTNEAQAEDVLYGDGRAVSALPSGASIILASTVSPAFVSQLERRLQSEGKDLKLVDSPVSGGVKRASEGTLTIMASGTDEALCHAGSVLSALSEKLYVIKGGCGAGSVVKMVNQLLAGVHIASAAEAMAYGARLGLNTGLLYDVITDSKGTSWMFENRTPHMLQNDYTPLSALNIFVKDLGIVSREAASRHVPLHVANVAHQLFLAGSAAGWGRLDDASVVKVYETLTGVKVEANVPVMSKDSILQSLPPEWPVDPIDSIRKLIEKSTKTLIVLDDDPTGTQTVHDIEVLTEWNVEALVQEFKRRPKCFFILTNSRSLSSEKAYKLIEDICKNVSTASKTVDNTDYTIVLRGDSTLRGHFPQEADAAVSVLGEMDAWIICPFFLEGGRYTINDTHYVADADRLVPAGETEFAKDASFGYKASNLHEWVEEKTGGRVPAGSVASISIQLIRKGGPDAVCEHLCNLKKGSTCIVNAASDRDMAVFAAGMIQAELKGKKFLCRTAASFVSARVGIIRKAPILPSDLGTNQARRGALIVVGSYVPKTTKQVEELKLQCGHLIKTIEISVDKVAMKSIEDREDEIVRAIEMADVYLSSCRDTLIMTSRKLIIGKTPSESLEINSKVSSALVEIVQRITTRPRYILAKGGITSSDLATKALGARCAKILGQALPGVPLWQLGSESKHPEVPYIVFPGNVGDANALAEVVKRWARPERTTSTKNLLLNAERGGYAIGSFNVYNLEGVEAVVAAAEDVGSPAILQIHPSALKEGGIPLVACCIAAAKQASVPITVHFDHGNSKRELLEVLELGFDSVMVDGSHLPFKDNISYTKFISDLAHSKDLLVEAELGRLSGTEDDLTVEDYEALLTDVTQANEFIDTTSIDALAVCIGNVHGKYPPGGPKLRLDLLKDLYELSSKKGVHLVLHGASGLPKELIEECIKLGVRKFNVNTEVRKAYMDSLSSSKKDLIQVMSSAKEAMKAVVAEKMRLFGSAGKA
ncbi:OLC1v1014344C1 [Oldenlandia corymbosa var. corymbosa]|uniref:OLC1v1014344C1 n=1 Tax=Oldenlandia corymbosa var. corymbosa TaxID=529605 RepID=A0AAV1E0G6_OLDCO|nr:OLC1v1014344C1 [Oldenlandia corymbosa var. corymbosa]